MVRISSSSGSNGPCAGAGRTRLRSLSNRILFGLSALAMGFLLESGTAMAEADTLERGDFSLGFFQTAAPYNRFWYHYDGPTACAGGPCSRFNINSYASTTPPVIGDQVAALESALQLATGLHIEYGILDQLTVSLETRAAYGSATSPGPSLGDSWLSFRWRTASQGALVTSFSGGVKIPGTYDPYSLTAPGAKQPDLEAAAHFGGLAARRRLLYDVKLAYRMRLPGQDPSVFYRTPLTYTSSGTIEGATQGLALAGPADEVSLDFTMGLFASRRIFCFLTGNLLNSMGGYSLDDYYLTAATDDEGRPAYETSEDPSVLFPLLEEDYIRLGAGVMFKTASSGTFYLQYSLPVLGKNTPAFFVPEGSSLPIGAVVLGFEVTFGTRHKTERLAERSALSETMLARDFSPH